MIGGVKLLNGPFSEFKNLYVIKGIAVNRTILHIGTPETAQLEATVDNPVLRLRMIRDGRVVEVPVIPGSSIKGVFRSFFEKIARSSGERVCNIFDVEQQKEEKTNPCIACRVFGNQGQASRVHFFDVMPVEESISSLYTVRMGVSIDRFFGSQRPGLLRTDEYVIPGLKWNVEIRVFNLDLEDENSKEAKFFKHVLKIFMEEGLQIGGRKSIGSGVFTLVDGTVKKFVLENGELKEVFGGGKKLSEWLS